MGSEYKQIFEREWHPVYRRGQLIQCCDCGMVHRFNFRERKGELEVQIFLEPRKTAASRRAKGIKIVQSKQ